MLSVKMKSKGMNLGSMISQRRRILQRSVSKITLSARQEEQKFLSSYRPSAIKSTFNAPLSIPRSFDFRSFSSTTSYNNNNNNNNSDGGDFTGKIRLEDGDDDVDDYEDNVADENFYDDDDDYDNDDYESFDERYIREIDDDDVRRKERKQNSLNDDDSSSISHKRIWLDPNTKIEDRVNRFLNRRLGTMHPLDIKLASVDLIRECGKMNSFEGMKYGHDILDRILEEKRYVNNSNTVINNSTRKQTLVLISERPFKVLMYGWANLCKTVPLAPQRMREILDLMIQEAEYDEIVKAEFYKQQQQKVDDQQQQQKEEEDTKEEENIFENVSCQPTVDIYNTLLQGLGYASSRSIAAAGEAEKVLNAMKGRNRKRGWHTKPNSKSFTLVITAFCQTRHRTAGDRAEAILRRMIEYHDVEKDLYYQETGQEYDTNNTSNNKRKIVTPDTVAYSAVIQAHAQSDEKGSAEKALNLLSELLIESNDNPALMPDAYVFANTINAFARMAARKKSRKGRFDAAQRAEDILWLMVDELKQSQENSSKQLQDGDDAALIRKRPFQVNVIPFNACLHGWAQSNIPESAPRAEALLQKMLGPELQEITSGMQPNTNSFNTVMVAWSKASRRIPDAPEKAEDLLNLMSSLSASKPDDESNGDDEEEEIRTVTKAKPDIQSYSTVMSAYAKSNRKDKANQTRRLLDSLLSTRPDKLTAVPFTTVLNAVAHSSTEEDDGNGKDGTTDWERLDYDGTDASSNSDPYSIALETYLEMEEDLYNFGIRADHIAYATMLDVLGKHTDVESIERRQRIESVLDDARLSGHVSSLVLQALYKVCPSQDMLQTLLQTSDPTTIHSTNALPREWTRNVPPKFRKLDNKNPSSQDKRYKKKRGRQQPHRKKQQRHAS